MSRGVMTPRRCPRDVVVAGAAAAGRWKTRPFPFEIAGAVTPAGTPHPCRERARSALGARIHERFGLRPGLPGCRDGDV
jgi:hypothetical protein